MALIPESAWLAIVIAAGATGVAYYGFSSHRIGRHFGMLSMPYAAVYAALLVTTFAPGVQTVDRNAAVVMALVSWGLYTRTLMGRLAVRFTPIVRGALIAIGFFALVIFPLLHLLFPEAQTAFSLLMVAMYRLAAVVGWVIGARPGLGPKK